MANAICSVGDCDGTATHRAMCRKHYSAWLYRQPPTSDADRCSTDGCVRRRQARGMCIPHWSTWQRRQPGYDRKRRERRERKVDIQCERCGKTASVTVQHAKVQRYCSLLCAGNRGKGTAVTLYVAPPRRHPGVTVIASNGAAWKSGQCQVCSARFLSKQFDATCSHECNRARTRDMSREYEHRRRARKRNAFVANVYRNRVYELDGYKCHLCGKRCDPTKAVPHPRAPTIDHVIPLASGGTHEPANCRTACFLCNAVKGDRGGGEQFTLDIA